MPDLHQIIASGNFPRIIKLAMKGGLQLDNVDSKGRTALHIACMKNNSTLIKFLLSLK